MHGEYVKGWRFDWEANKEDVDRLLAAGRETAAAFCADPGVASCPTCGQSHWREFECFLCCRCGAEVTIGTEPYTTVFPDGRTYTGTRERVTAGPEARPEKVPPRLVEGLRVRWNPPPVDYYRADGVIERHPDRGNWRAGKVSPGACG